MHFEIDRRIELDLGIARYCAAIRGSISVTTSITSFSIASRSAERSL
jgi:hypothetical protein